MIVEMTQFIRPDGRKRPTSCEITDELSEKMKEILGAGLRFTAEVIDDQVCFCIEDEEQDLSIEVVRNEPGVREAIEKMIRNFKVPKC